MRIGVGHSARPLDPDRPLFLAGVRVPSAPGLSGPGDGDVVTRAIADALLGAAGLDETAGRLLDAADGEGALGVLEEAVREVEALGYQVVNVVVRIVSVGPELSGHRDEMCAGLAERLHLSPSALSLRSSGGAAAGEERAREQEMEVRAVALLDRAPGVEAVHARLRGRE